MLSWTCLFHSILVSWESMRTPLPFWYNGTPPGVISPFNEPRILTLETSLLPGPCSILSCCLSLATLSSDRNYFLLCIVDHTGSKSFPRACFLSFHCFLAPTYSTGLYDFPLYLEASPYVSFPFSSSSSYVQVIHIFLHLLYNRGKLHISKDILFMLTLVAALSIFN